MEITLEQLEALTPCEDGAAYWKEKGIEDLAGFMLQAHADDHSGWAHWLFARVVDVKTRVRYALYAARLVEHLASDDNVKKCIDTVDRWLNGDLSNDDLRNAAQVAYDAADAYTPHAATYAATYAADAVIYSARPTYAAYAAHAAADAAAFFAYASYTGYRNANAAGESTRKETHLKIIKYGIELLKEQEEHTKNNQFNTLHNV